MFEKYMPKIAFPSFIMKCHKLIGNTNKNLYVKGIKCISYMQNNNQ